VLQLVMCLATALLGVLILLVGGSSEMGLFGWVFLVLGGLGALLTLVLPVATRR
jgi:hypothetical protein